MRNFIIGIALIVGLAAALIAVELAIRIEADVVEGRPRIIDGDSLAFGELNVRLAGMDAPERAQACRDSMGDSFACGRSATDYLTFLIGDGSVTCRGRGRDRYGRMIGQCRVNGRNISAAMVRRGWAVAYLGDLDAEEREARELGVGLWAGEFIAPEQWRRERRSAAVAAPLGAVREAIARLAAIVSGDPIGRAPFDE